MARAAAALAPRVDHLLGARAPAHFVPPFAHGAIQALMSQAERGRLVVVISHLQAVAENIDRVLYIMSSPAGSQAHFLDLHERGRFDMESAGLIA